MPNEKLQFQNEDGESLSARIDFPKDQETKAFALFAHCFTCSKDLTSVRNISRALNEAGIAVMRFDFTGLGESEGDFADTNFSSNVNDLVYASKVLADQYAAPKILIGHSLGGAAVLSAAVKIDAVQAVVTIGAPSSPDHVQHLFKGDVEEINANDVAEVSIGGRDFTIKKQFLEDLDSASLELCIKCLRRPILVMHSPQDTTVGIQNAGEIYGAAMHPKSFISLDGADHLLTDRRDSMYVGSMIAGWASRYLE
jgi:putative redox protein